MTNEVEKTKVALVTGSSTGLGRAIALRLAADRYFVYVTYHTNREEGQHTLDQIEREGGAGELHVLEVRDESSVTELMARIRERHGHLNVLVNNAVQDIPKPIDQASLEDWRTVIQIKLDGAFLCTKHAIALMSNADNANVIIITSFEGEKPNPDYLAYGVATAGLIAMVKGLAVYLPKFGIRVNAVSPGEVRTPLWKKVGPDSDEMWAGFARNNPMGRVARPEDVADSVMLLVNDKGRFLNGNFLFVNGGSHFK